MERHTRHGTRWTSRTATLTLLAGLAAGPATRPTGDRVALSLDDLFATLDADHDGRITRAEATGAYAQRFARWDAAGRGYATRDDVRADRAAHGIGDDGRRLRPAARRAAPPVLLLGPADWRLEQSAMPPSFAPSVGLTGTDETRFAPGMYDTAAADYFTYAKAMAVDGDPAWTAADVATFMDRYYRGLTASRARRSRPSTRPATEPAVPDPASTARAVPAADGEARFTASVPFVDAFTDGRRVTLQVEVQVLPRPSLRRTYVVMLVSPSPSDSPTWARLRDVGRAAAARVPPGAATRP